MMEKVILVNESDREIGLMEKMEAHEKGLLHRAFSVFIFNSKGELLLQRRAANKYHSGGLWTNTCCSHPRPDETNLEGAQRRLLEEMGISTELNHLFHFIYKAKLDHELTEHELDHVFIGTCDSPPVLNREEAEDFKYVTPDELEKLIEDAPDEYTVWFKIIFREYKNRLLTE